MILKLIQKMIKVICYPMELYLKLYHKFFGYELPYCNYCDKKFKDCDCYKHGDLNQKEIKKWQ